MRKTILAIAVMGVLAATGLASTPAFAQPSEDLPNAQGNPYPFAYRFGYPGYPAPGYSYPASGYYAPPAYTYPSYRDSFAGSSYYPRASYYPRYRAPRYYTYSAPSYAYAPRYCNPYDVARPGVNTACY